MWVAMTVYPCCRNSFTNRLSSVSNGHQITAGGVGDICKAEQSHTPVCKTRRCRCRQLCPSSWQTLLFLFMKLNYRIPTCTRDLSISISFELITIFQIFWRFECHSDDSFYFFQVVKWRIDNKSVQIQVCL